MHIRGGKFGMKKELIGIIICMLLVGSGLPVTGNVSDVLSGMNAGASYLVGVRIC